MFIGLVFSAGLFVLLDFFAIQRSITICLTLTSLTVIYFITQAMPIWVTALIPIVLFPVTGILDSNHIASSFTNFIIVFTALAYLLFNLLERVQLSELMGARLIASMKINNGQRLIFSFLAISIVLSMWFTNSFVCLIMLPLALGVLRQQDDASIYAPSILAIAFGSTIGGMGTTIGTSSSLIFVSTYSDFTGQEFNFFRWMTISLPIILTAFPLVYWWLSRNITSSVTFKLTDTVQWGTPQKRVALLVASLYLFWIFRSQPFGGWTSILKEFEYSSEILAIIGLAVIFLTRGGFSENPKQRLFQWTMLKSIPFHILLILVSGLVISKAFQVSDTAQWIGDFIANHSQLSLLLFITLICVCIALITEFTNNVLVSFIFFPIIAATAISSNIPVEILLVPAAFAASCAFMLPISTPPNALVFGTGYVTVKAMAVKGIGVNLIMLCCIIIWSYLVLVY